MCGIRTLSIMFVVLLLGACGDNGVQEVEIAVSEDRAADPAKLGSETLPDGPADAARQLPRQPRPELLPYPPGGNGVRTPLDLWRYAGRSGSSFSSPVLGMPFSNWVRMNEVQKPELMAEVHAYMRQRYDFSGESIPGVRMSIGLF